MYVIIFANQQRALEVIDPDEAEHRARQGRSKTNKTSELYGAQTTMMTGDSPHVPDQSDVEEFTKWATSPSAWFTHAEQLHLSSELLWRPISRLFDTGNTAGPIDAGEADHGGLHSPAYLLVAGFAIEAMLKAAAIQVELNAGGIDRVIVAGSSPTFQPWVKTHKLEKLAARAGITCRDELLIYLRRFERYILWAGRYPVPVAPPPAAEPRGFDYQAGTQDRGRFEEIYDLAKAAYLRAREAERAWSEPTGVGNYRQREAVWMATSTVWLRVVRPALIDHAQRVAKGDRGVLQVNIDAPEMRSHLTRPTSLVRLEPAWFPADEFIAIVGGRDGVGAETARRWADTLVAMDPSRDVALFLHSTPDADGRWFSRYIFLKSGSSRPSEGTTSIMNKKEP